MKTTIHWRRLLFAFIFILIGAGGLVTINWTMDATSTETFCISCHEMNNHAYAELQETTQRISARHAATLAQSDLLRDRLLTSVSRQVALHHRARFRWKRLVQMLGAAHQTLRKGATLWDLADQSDPKSLPSDREPYQPGRSGR